MNQSAQNSENDPSQGQQTAIDATHTDKRTWLTIAKLFLGLLAILLMVKTVGWLKQVQAEQQWKAVNSVTPDALLTRCGRPSEDETKDVYPIVMRTMSYKSGSQGMIVLEFSRTADEPNNWVFLSMKDAAGNVTYDNPESKISALPCLGWR